MRTRYRTKGDSGQTQILLLLGVVALMFLSVIVVKLGRASDVRSKAQIAADSAALAGARVLEQYDIGQIEAGFPPQPILAQFAPNAAAQEYATRNQATLDNYQQTGVMDAATQMVLVGNYITVNVHTNDCVLLNTPLPQNQPGSAPSPCVDANGDRGTGLNGQARSTAVTPNPGCVPIYAPPPNNTVVIQMRCNGQDVADGWGHLVVNPLGYKMFEPYLTSSRTAPTTKYTGLSGLLANKNFGQSNFPQNVALGRAMAAQMGWGNDQFGCLYKLWMQESGWNTFADNPSSGAYGIAQALPPEKYASAGPDWRTNPATQIKWGLSYIAGRYGTPCGAWAHEVAYNWY